MPMLSNFIKVIFRYFLRSRFFTLLNIAGLSISIASCIIIFLFVRNELSYDRFHTNGERIFRVIRESQINGVPYDIGITAGPFAAALHEEYANHIESIARTFSFTALVQVGETKFNEDKLLLADKNFFNFFSYPLVQGNPSDVLRHPNTIVLSEAFAKKYFGDADPVGKALRLDDQYDMLVTGVFTAPPGNTHLQFDAVGSINILEPEDWYHDWWGNAFHTYVRVKDERSASALNAMFPSFMDKYFGDDFARIGNRIELKLEPLHNIYFNYGTRYENNVKHGDIRYVWVFGSVGALLIILAAINYVNLATAQSTGRSKEVGIRKTLGSSKRFVVAQFLGESTTLSVLSLLVAIAIAQFSIPFFNASFSLDLPGLFEDVWLFVFLIGLVLIIGLLSGAYPSFLLASFKPAQVLKGQLVGSYQYLILRKGLVVFQFAISAFMIIATLFIGDQLKYMNEKDLGFQPEQLLVINLNNGQMNRERLAFREALLQQPGFINASFASGHPGGFYDASTVSVQGSDVTLRMRTLWCDDAFQETMGLELAHGRFFSKAFPADSTSAVLLNETAVKQLGWTNEEALGKRVILSMFDSTYKEVIGVLKDYHFTSLKEQIEPLVVSYMHQRGQLIARVESHRIHQSVEALESLWNSYQSGFPLEFLFLDEVIDRLYQAERRQARIFTLFSGVSVAIACLGIFGLAMFMAAQRRKEIGIRKVLGASANQVSFLLMKDLVRLVMIAIVIAIPICYYALDQWLQRFPYRTPLTIGAFIWGGLIIFVLATLIVGINASRTASQNPVSSLRSE